MKEKSERSKKWKFHLSKELESNILIIKLEDRNLRGSIFWSYLLRLDVSYGN